MPTSPKSGGRGEPLLRVGISSCLLGERVRYDGGHRRDAWLADHLGRIAEFVPVCPEVELGLGVPRPTIRLEDDGRGGVLLVEPSSREDLTARMERWSAGRLALLEKADLDGYVFKGNSPSCGPGGVGIWTAEGRPAGREGRGLFAAALLRRFPFLPVEEEGGLQDPLRRENFVLRLYAYRRAKEGDTVPDPIHRTSAPPPPR